MTGNDQPICVQDPCLWQAIPAALAGGVLCCAATLVVVWLALGAPTPARFERPWWTRSSLRAVAQHTVARAGRLRARSLDRPTPRDEGGDHASL